MTTLTIKFKDRKQALLMKRLVEDLSGVEEISLMSEKKKNETVTSNHFINKYGVTEKEFYARIQRAEEDIKQGRVLTKQQLKRKLNNLHERDL